MESKGQTVQNGWLFLGFWIFADFRTRIDFGTFVGFGFLRRCWPAPAQRVRSVNMVWLAKLDVEVTVVYTSRFVGSFVYSSRFVRA